MNSDPAKARAWQQRGAAAYQEKQRQRRSAPRDRSQNTKSSTKPRRNDAPWRAECLALRGRYCRACGATGRIELDHVKPRSQGGPSIVQNGLPLCPTCHADKTASRLRFRFEWFDADQIMWLADVGWVAWDTTTGEPYGRGLRHFEPLTETQRLRYAASAPVNMKGGNNGEDD